MSLMYIKMDSKVKLKAYRSIQVSHMWPLRANYAKLRFFSRFLNIASRDVIFPTILKI